MNTLITVTKIGLIGTLLAVTATGCCLFGNDSSCDKACCDKACCENAARPAKKTSGINTSMTLGVGTDGLSIGSESNVGSHGLSGAVSTH